MRRCNFFNDQPDCDELHRQVVEQFRMGGRIAAEAEIARRADDSETEVMHPHAIDDHARGDRVCGIDDGLRQFETPAAVAEQLVVSAAETTQEARRRQRARVIRIPAEKDVPGRRRRQIFDGHRPRRRAIVGGLGQHRIVADENGTRVVTVTLRVYELELIDGHICRGGGPRRTARNCWRSGSSKGSARSHFASAAA